MPRCLVDRLLGPVVGAADGLPGLGRPRVVTELARARHSMKRPHLRAGAHVEGADITRRRRVLLIRRRAKDDEVLEDTSREAALLVDRGGIAVEPLAQIDPAVDAERRDALAGARVDLPQEIVEAENQAPIRTVRTLPVVHAPSVETLHARMRPDLLAGSGVERHERALRAESVDNAAHDERVEVGLPWRVGPRDLEPVHVALVDAGRRHEARAVGATRVVPPLARRP